MANPQTVDIYAPDGSLGTIPFERFNDALQSGAVPAVRLQSPDGKIGTIPANRVNDALKAGGKVLPYEQQEVQHPGFWKSLGSDLWNTYGPPTSWEQVKQRAIGSLGMNPITAPISQALNHEQDQQQIKQRAAEGHGIPYQVGAQVAEKNPILPTNVAGMEQSAREGDVGGVLGHAAAPVTALAAGALIAGLKPAVKPPTSLRAAFPGKQAAVVPEAAGLPADAIAGAEDVYRAAAPTGTNPKFRQNLYVASPDLADIAHKVNLSEAKGGIINPDMRVRATVNAINEHLGEMYQSERVPQIARHADDRLMIADASDSGTVAMEPVTKRGMQGQVAQTSRPKINADVRNGLEYLARSAGEASDRALAQKALDSGELSLAETDQLAKTANQNLLSYERMPGEEQLKIRATNPRVSGLKQLDKQLTGTLDEVLKSKGEAGVYDYERRYAALSEVRSQFQRRLNEAELNQPGIVKKILKPVATSLTGKSGVASASQAATADVNIGRMLQKGMDSLRNSGISAKLKPRVIDPNGRINGAHVQMEDDLFGQAKRELGAGASTSQILMRAQQLKNGR